MHRQTTGLLLALALLLLPGTARAEEEGGPATMVVVHDVSDLVAWIPDLAATLDDLLPGVQIEATGSGQLIVNAPSGRQGDVGLLLDALRRDLLTPGDAEGREGAAKRALGRARANAGTLRRLHEHHLDMRVEDAEGRQVLQLLAASADLDLLLSPGANERLGAQALSLDLQQVAPRQVLDLVLQASDLRFLLDGGIVHVVAAEASDPGFIRLDFVEEVLPGSTAREKPSEEGWEEPEGRGGATPQDESRDLKTLVQSLHEEVRALREEVREVRRILEEMRDG